MSVKYPMLGAEEYSSVVKCSPSTGVSPQFDPSTTNGKKSHVLMVTLNQF